MASKKPPQAPSAVPVAVDATPSGVRERIGELDAMEALFPEAAPAYQVLARKYRPRTFEDLVGQEAMVRILTNAFATGRIAHAFMLTGVRGVGKTTTARLLARSLNYRSAELDAPSIRLDPPGVHCASIMAGSHPDVLELDAASRTGVGDMRDLLDGLRYAPVSARYKVYIIDEVHMLSTAAFNALLKTLEEPPPHVKFIFATTEVRRVPVTVLSRCQRFSLQRFTTEALARHLGTICLKEGAQVSADALALIARAAEGSARDGLSILDQVIVQGAGDSGEIGADAVRDMLGLADRSRIFDLLELAISGDNRRALEEVSTLLEAGADASVLIRDMMDVVVEVSRAQALGEAYTFAGPLDWRNRTLAMAQRLSQAQSARIWRLLLVGFEDCARAPDPAAAAQMIILRLAAAASLPPPEEAAKLLGAGRDGAGAGQLSHQPQNREPEAPSTKVASSRDVPEAGPSLRLSTLTAIIAELEARRQIDLRYEIETYVRPAAIDFGDFRYAAAPGAPAGLSQKIRAWLESVTGVEWRVQQTDEGVAESSAERRNRIRRERMSAVEAHPRVKEALRAFPGARVLRIDEPEALDALSDDEDAVANYDDRNVVHVDFTGRSRSPEIEIEPEPEESED
jgi:DNA polymerase-3 subunit gamma/tau